MRGSEVERWCGAGQGGIQGRACQAKEPLEQAGLSCAVVTGSVCFVLSEAWLSSSANCLGGVCGAQRMP